MTMVKELLASEASSTIGSSLKVELAISSSSSFGRVHDFHFIPILRSSRLWSKNVFSLRHQLMSWWVSLRRCSCCCCCWFVCLLWPQHRKTGQKRWRQNGDNSWYQTISTHWDVLVHVSGQAFDLSGEKLILGPVRRKKFDRKREKRAQVNNKPSHLSYPYLIFSQS